MHCQSDRLPKSNAKFPPTVAHQTKTLFENDANVSKMKRVEIRMMASSVGIGRILARLFPSKIAPFLKQVFLCCASAGGNLTLHYC